LVDTRNGVVTLTINRPQVRNAVDADTMIRLREALESHAADPDTRVFVITGAAGAFSAGADIQAAMQMGITPLEAQRILTDAYGPAIRAVRACPWPVIAAVDGMAAGIGCDLALACDLRLCSERGKFAELFIRVGLIPDGGGTYLLPRLIGLGRAFEMMVTGESVAAADELAMGLANRVFPTEGFEAQVRAYADKLASQAPLALVRGKRAMLAALEDRSLLDAMNREAQFQREIFESEDGFEGFRAFIEKRPAQWKGR
jgi:2-(1,2-epoxy-1,2-dihydrophenyl)acetyl-CoA isomerase